MESLIGDAPRLAGVNAMPMATPRSRPNNGEVKTRVEEKQGFDAQRFLDAAGVSRKISTYGRRDHFSAGRPRDEHPIYSKGWLEPTVVNDAGKEAVVAILGPGDFFGEGSLAGQRSGSTAPRNYAGDGGDFEKQEMIRVLHADRALSDQFIKHLLSDASSGRRSGRPAL